MTPTVRNAFLAAEEPNFYVRSPISPLIDIARGVIFNHQPRSSAISAAVTRCLMALSPSCCGKHIDRAIGQIVLQGRVEKTWSKDRIFELYLNETWLGRGAYGAAAAAHAYFGKQVSELTIDEAAYLAGLARAPNYLGRVNERGAQRRNVVIDRMEEAGTISSPEAASAKQQPLLLREARAPI